MSLQNKMQSFVREMICFDCNRWYFALLSISGVFSVTFSIVFAYVADVTSDEDRSAAYGLVSKSFAIMS